MFFDNLLKLLAASSKIGFAITFAGLGLITGNYYGALPYTLPVEQMGYIQFGTLLGIGMLLASVLASMGTVVRRKFASVQRWWWRQTVISRVGELTPREQLALYWIAHHKDQSIVGSRYTDPFQRLCQKGFLVSTEITGANQSFGVSRWVYWRKRKIARFVDPKFHHLSGDFEAPWLITPGRRI
jgi:hypothetical protein